MGGGGGMRQTSVMPCSLPFHEIQPHTTVNDLLAACPEAAAVLADRKLDTCCGGGLPLVDACARAGVPVDAVLHDLERVWSVA